MEERDLLYMVGGLTVRGITCDIWTLRLEHIVQAYENLARVFDLDFWQQIFLDNKLTCRYGHSSAKVTPTGLIFHGGRTENAVWAARDDLVVLSIDTNELFPVRISSEAAPKARAFHKIESNPSRPEL